MNSYCQRKLPSLVAEVQREFVFEIHFKLDTESDDVVPPEAPDAMNTVKTLVLVTGDGNFTLIL